MLLMSLFWGQTALTESGILPLIMGVLSITLAGGLLTGVFESKVIPDEELSRLASRTFLAMLVIFLIASVLIFLIVYV